MKAKPQPGISFDHQNSIFIKFGWWERRQASGHISPPKKWFSHICRERCIIWCEQHTTYAHCKRENVVYFQHHLISSLFYYTTAMPHSCGHTSFPHTLPQQHLPDCNLFCVLSAQPPPPPRVISYSPNIKIIITAHNFIWMLSQRRWGGQIALMPDWSASRSQFQASFGLKLPSRLHTNKLISLNAHMHQGLSSSKVLINFKDKLLIGKS